MLLYDEITNGYKWINTTNYISENGQFLRTNIRVYISRKKFIKRTKRFRVFCYAVVKRMGSKKVQEIERDRWRWRCG